MKKFLLPIVVIVILILSIFAFLFLSRDKKVEEVVEDEVVAEIPFNLRPFTSLTPSADGHWLNLKVENIKVPNAISVDYELVYTVGATGLNQGVPGTVKLDNGKTSFERDLLLGSESSGKFRYDEGVEKGMLTLRFRNQNGKLVGKLETDFSLLTSTDLLISIDKSFEYQLSDIGDDYFVVMNTFGLLSSDVQNVSSGPYGIFTSAKNLDGEVQTNGDWTSLENIFFIK